MTLKNKRWAQQVKIKHASCIFYKGLTIAVSAKDGKILWEYKLGDVILNPANSYQWPSGYFLRCGWQYSSFGCEVMSYHKARLKIANSSQMYFP